MTKIINKLFHVCTVFVLLVVQSGALNVRSDREAGCLAPGHVSSKDLSFKQSLGAMVAPAPTTPVDRRRILQALTILGIASASVTAGVQISQPKTFKELKAPDYLQSEATRQAFHTLETSFYKLHQQIQALLAAHDFLFVRTVKVEWDTTETRKWEECETDDKGNETCEEKEEDYTKHHSDYTTLEIDDGITSFKNSDRAYLSKLKDAYAAYLEHIKNFDKKGLKKLEGLIDATDWMNMNTGESNTREFAEHFGGTWQERNISSLAQILVAAAIGIPATAIFLGYGKFVDNVSGIIERTYNAHSVREKALTRRAFFQGVVGAMTVAGLFKSANRMEERSARIKDEAEKKIRKTVVTGNEWNAEKLFMHFFGKTPKAIINDMNFPVTGLRALTFEEVDRSVRDGLLRLDYEERRLLNGITFRGRNKKTTRKDSHYDINSIRAYVKLAHDTAELFEKTEQALSVFFKNGVPEVLRPAMRAYYITRGVDETVASEKAGHLWGLAGDMGLVYGAASMALMLSEIRGKHHEAVYSLVQGIFNQIDLAKLSAYERAQRMLLKFTGEQRKRVHGNEKVRRAVKQNIRNLLQIAEAYEETDIVHTDVFDREKMKGICDQLSGNQLALHKKIIDIYINKTLEYFTRRQLSMEDLFEKIRSGKIQEGELIEMPSMDDFIPQLISMIQQADQGGYFVYDLIAEGVIDDNHEDETWIDTESHELKKNINYWADRIAALFASVQSTYASLHILPDDWFVTEEGTHNKLSRKDILAIFRQRAASRIKSEADKKKAKNEIEQLLNKDQGNRLRVITDEEAELRIMLRELQEAVSQGREVRILLDNEPRLRVAEETEDSV